MNERIKELAQQAGAQPTNLPPYVTLDWQNFAELIIQECAELCDINDKEQGDILREHFGIGEHK